MIFNCLAAGTFLYIACSEVIVEEFSIPNFRCLKLFFYLVGIACISLLKFLDPDDDSDDSDDSSDKSTSEEKSIFEKCVNTCLSTEFVLDQTFKECVSACHFDDSIE